MLFLLQPRCDALHMEKQFLLEELQSSGHSFLNATMKNIRLGKFDLFGDSIIPVGDIKYVEQSLKHFYGIDHINPMEVPLCLRQEKYLKRSYEIVPFKNLPENGRYFIKDVSGLKLLSCVGNKNTVLSMNGNRSHNYLCSEYVSDILSEYRIYFIDGHIENVCNYNGDPTVPVNFSLIKEANEVFKRERNYTESYTMDVMVTKSGTAIVEMHPFVSVGLYSTLWGRNLVHAYIDGIRYVKEWNTPCCP